MSLLRPIGGCRLVAALALLMSAVAAQAADQFPFDREMILEARPMRPGKRMPILTVATDGRAEIDLWCKSVNGRVELGEGTITITADPLPDALPSRMSANQCTPERVAADESLLATITQAMRWRRLGDGVQLNGAAVMNFRPGNH